MVKLRRVRAASASDGIEVLGQDDPAGAELDDPQRDALGGLVEPDRRAGGCGAAPRALVEAYDLGRAHAGW